MDRPWKKFEREIAALFRGKRFWSNSGEAIDVESETVVAQCKHVKACSLGSLAMLAHTAQKQGEQKFKAGVVAVKLRQGKGRWSPTLIVMTAATWQQLHGPVDEAPGPRSATPAGAAGASPQGGSGLTQSFTAAPTGASDGRTADRDP